AVYEAGQENLVAGANHRDVGIARFQVVKTTEREDDAVLLKHRAIRRQLRRVPVDRARDHGAAADQRHCHKISSDQTANASCSAKARSTSSRSSSVRSRRKASLRGEN